MNTAQISSTAFLVVTVWLACGTGCSEYEPPAVHCMNNTPGLWFSAFRLPEDEWGKPDDVLVTSWYISSEWTAYACYGFIWCGRVRVLHPDESGYYHIPNEPLPGRVELFPLFPQITRQRYPMVCVLNGKGKYGVHYRESQDSDMEWYRFQDAPILKRTSEGYVRDPAKTSAAAQTADATLRFLACFLLSEHDPEGSPPPGLTGTWNVISKDHAREITCFIDRHAGGFSWATRLLWHRLADHYEVPAMPKEDENWRWEALHECHQRRPMSDQDLFVWVLPEREQLLILGSYTKPDKQYDANQEGWEILKEMIPALERYEPECGDASPDGSVQTM